MSATEAVRGLAARLARKKSLPSLLDVFRRHGADFRARHAVTPEQSRVLHAIQVCRTAALGGHLYVCDRCGVKLPLYNSCRNRHCPECQALDQARWIAAREARILPVGHHHVVFTLPAELRALARRDPRGIYALLFDAAAHTLALLAERRLHAQLGVTAVLHTWTRELSLHPHVHCVVTAGGLSKDGKRWKDATRFLFPVAEMKAVFRGQILAGLARMRELGRLALDEAAWRALLASLPKKKRWVVFIERPFGRSTHVIRYLGRYTHRVAISDARLISVDDRGVTFRTRGDERATLAPDEFIGRFLLHVLPRGFHKIRHFGLYSAAAVGTRLPIARSLVGDGDRERTEDADPEAASEGWASLLEKLTGEDPLLCPICGRGRLIAAPLPDHRRSRGPP